MTHPEETELAAFLAAELPPQVSDAVGAHIDGCPPCRATVERLTAVPEDLTASLLVSAVAGPADASPREGPQLPGYDDFRELGRGGSGIVYRVRDLAWDGLVAVKMMRSGVFATSAERTRFLAEAETALRLQHPNIVRVTAIGGRDAVPYFAIDYAFGGSLAGRLDGTPVSSEVAGRLVQTIASAVQFAHDAGVIHRDLKPGNILLDDGLDPFTRPKVADFGMAKLAGDELSATPTQAVLGTPSYMAPEQAFGRSKQVGPTADVYSLGAILYELLTGRPPFKGETPYETLLQVRTLPLIWPRSLRPGTPRSLEAVCLKCLERNPVHRYPTALALADDLGRYLNGETVWAKTPGPPRQLFRWAMVNRSTAALAATLAIVLLSAIAALSILWVHANEQRDQAQRSAEAALESRIAARKTLVLYSKTTIRFFRTADSMTAEDIDSLRRANIEAEGVLSAPTGDPKEEHDAAYSLLQLADSLNLIRDWDAATRLCRSGVRVLKRLSELHPNNSQFAFDYSQGCSQLSGVLTRTGKPVEAEAMTHEAIRFGKIATTLEPNNDEYTGSLANYRSQLARILIDQRDFAAAEILLTEAITETQRLCHKYPSDPIRWNYARLMLYSRAVLRFTRDRSIEGFVEHIRFGLSVVKSNRRFYLLPDWSSVLAPAAYSGDAAAALDHVGRRREADALLGDGLTAAESLVAEAPYDLKAKLALADHSEACGRRRLVNNPQEARVLFRRAAAIYEELEATSFATIAKVRQCEMWATSPDPEIRNAARAVALARADMKLQHVLGIALYSSGKYDEARLVLSIPAGNDLGESLHIRRRAYLILTQVRLGEKDTARRELDLLTRLAAQ